MQQALSDQGFLTGNADGIFGRGTEQAVKQFQQSHGLTADGLAGNATLTALYGVETGGDPAATQTPGITATPAAGGSGSGSGGTLRYGSTGDAVKALQEALNKLGYSTNGIDGKYGRGTQTAVKQFKEQQTDGGRPGRFKDAGVDFQSGRKRIAIHADTHAQRQSLNPNPDPHADPYTNLDGFGNTGSNPYANPNLYRRIQPHS
jgi:peptidoglycan hydrolase-like protein with peptidoglycan-binding domain